MPKYVEQLLIDEFINACNNVGDKDIQTGELQRSNCRAKKYADIEYTSKSGVNLVIEAKFH